MENKTRSFEHVRHWSEKLNNSFKENIFLEKTIEHTGICSSAVQESKEIYLSDRKIEGTPKQYGTYNPLFKDSNRQCYQVD